MFPKKCGFQTRMGSNIWTLLYDGHLKAHGVKRDAGNLILNTFISQYARDHQVSGYNRTFLSIIQSYDCKQVAVGLLHAKNMAEVVLLNVLKIGFPASLFWKDIKKSWNYPDGKLCCLIADLQIYQFLTVQQKNLDRHYICVVVICLVGRLLQRLADSNNKVITSLSHSKSWTRL